MLLARHHHGLKPHLRRAITPPSNSSLLAHFSCTTTHPSSAPPASPHPTPSPPSTKPQVIFSGIQPTGIPHLGNYLGALLPWVKLQDAASPDTKLLFSIVDLHAITVPQDRERLKRWKREMLAVLLAIGLCPERCVLFCQSAVPAHVELMWILSCTASMGYLSRMTQWKSKLSLSSDASPLDGDNRSKLKLGLFSYPVLQAADILVHGATHVPVGEDQSQHLEFARECATNFNHAYGKHLVAPETIVSPAKRIMSLTHPTRKMSKSHANPASRILLTDTPTVIRKKIMSAITDSTNAVSYDPVQRPGVSNLLELMAHLGDHGKSAEELGAEMQGMKLGELKKRVAETVVEKLQPVGEMFREVSERRGGRLLREVEEMGRERARASAEGTMEVVREAVGFVER